MVCREQIALDVRLERGGGAPWGFKLRGGEADEFLTSRIPLTVTQVETDTPASRAGLADGDEVVAINGVPAQTISREEAHEIIVGCKLRIQLDVVRTIGSPEEADDISPDIPCEVPSHARSATASPFIQPIKPFRPFSTEPLEEIPPLERPIILSPFYHDDFAKLKKVKDFEPPTRFKLEISKYYVPEAEERSVSESYSQMQTVQLTSMEELRTELDMEQIEDTAAFIVDDSLNKAMIMTKDTTQEMGHGLSHKECSEIVAKDAKVSVSLLTQLLDQTADEISKSKTCELLEKREFSKVETYDKKKESVEYAKTENTTLETMSKELTVQSTESKVEKASDYREEIEKHQLEESEKNVEKNSEVIESQIQTEVIEEESKSAKEIIKTLNTKAEKNVQGIKIFNKEKDEKKQRVQKDVSGSKMEAMVTENKKNFESRSFNDIKHQTISTANLLAEQRAYTLGLQTIPNIQGRVQSSYHYDLLLKTFFIHLTDVMVALSRIILADGSSRSVSPMPPQKAGVSKHEVSQQITTQNTSQEEIQKETREETHGEKETKKMSGAKFAQLAQFKTEDLTQKMDAVICEFKKVEEVQSQESLEVSHTLRGKSISTIEEEVLKENDPLDWLSKVDESKADVSTDDTSQLDIEDVQGKIIYVATVEAHQAANVDALECTTDLNITENFVANTAEIDISTEKCEEVIKTEEFEQEVSEVEERKLSNDSVIAEETVVKIQQSIESSQTYETSQQAMIQESRTSEQIQSIALEGSKIESLVEERKVQSIQESVESTLISQETEIKSVTQEVAVSQMSTFEAKMDSVKAVESREFITSSIEPRKPSIENGESVRKSDVESPVSVTSEDSNVPVPQTPLTDEYIFRLQIPLEESKNPLPPSPPVEHEDPYTVKKPKLIPHIETSLHTPKLFGDPEKDQTPFFTDQKLLDTNGTVTPRKSDAPGKAIKEIATDKTKKADPGTTNKVDDRIPGIKQSEPSLKVAQTLVTSETNASNASNIETKALITNLEEKTTHGARRTSTSFVEENLVQEVYDQRNSTMLSSTDNSIQGVEKYNEEFEIQRQNVKSVENVHAHYVKQNCGLVSRNNETETHNGGLVKQIQNDGQNINIVHQIMTPVLDKSSYEKQNCGLVSRNHGMETHHGGLVKRIENGGQNTIIAEHILAPIPDNSPYVKQNCGLLYKIHGGMETHHGGLVKQIQNSEQIGDIVSRNQITTPISETSLKQACYIKQNCGLVSKNYGVLTHHGGLVKRIQDGRLNQNGGVVDVIDGTIQGIVDSLDNAGILDEEVAKQLGRAGLTEEKIAELISGESEMLREAHVIGVDFKKIKPQLETLKYSEVLKALNDELTKTKQEKLKEERKWTTFLQRPDRGVPRSRFGYVTDPAVPPEQYKIRIVKQPKPRVAPDYKPQDFETGPLPWEARAANEPPAPKEPRQEPILIPEDAPQFLEALDNLPESEVPDLEDTGIPLPPEPTEPASPPPSPHEADDTPDPPTELAPEEPSELASEEPAQSDAAEDMERNQLAEKIMGSIQSMVDPCASVEEQLKQMRLQLSALAQLPGVISQTLELVTEQLGQLTEQKDDEKCGVTVTEVPEETPTTEDQETEGAPAQEDTSVEETSEIITDVVQIQVEPPTPSTVVCVQQNSESRVDMSEQQRIEMQKKDVISELQLEHEARQVKQRPTPRVANAKPKPAFGPLVPQERPLVLPGGRRWRNAKDAYNEDFIRETLASQAEIIQGKAKGCQYESYLLPYDERKVVNSALDGFTEHIRAHCQHREGVHRDRHHQAAPPDYIMHYRINFAKWEKPAKTLDHLKESDVYKMIHNMETGPVKQVEQLPPRVIAESEYREQSRIREILEENGMPIKSSRPSSVASQALIPQVLGRCSPVCAAKCLEICFNECPLACGGVLPDVCAGKCQNGEKAATEHHGCLTAANQYGRVTAYNKNGGTTAKQNGVLDGRDPGHIVTELIVPPAPPRVELPPRPNSVAEAVEIVTCYVDTHASKEARTRTTPAA